MKYFKMINPADTGILKVVKLDNGELIKSYIPEKDDNTQWLEYQDWVTKGNTAIVAPPGPHYNIDYDNDRWVEDTAKTNDAYKLSLLNTLRHTDTVLLKLIIEIFKALQTKGLITKEDLGVELVDSAQMLRQALQEYEAL